MRKKTSEDDTGKVTHEQRALQHFLLQMKAEEEREAQRKDPMLMVFKEQRRNLCDLKKTELGAENLDYETAKKIYQEQIIKKCERQNAFQNEFDKEIQGFASRWKRF